MGKKQFSIGSIILNIIRYLILIIAIGTFTFASYNLTKSMLEYKEGDDEYDRVRNMFMVENNNENQSDIVKNEKEISKNEDNKSYNKNSETTLIWKYDFNKLKSINQDAVGYIKQDNTLINYPILKTTNNNYYLYHTIDNTYNKNGSIFMDYRMEKGFEEKNCIIYGHNMWTDAMFGTLPSFYKEDYFNSHNAMDIYVGNKHYEYKVFASFECDAIGDNVYDYIFESNDDFIKWAKQQQQRSYVKTSYEVNKNTKIITLSTCTTRGSDAKRVVLLLIRNKIMDI